jgi:hypothetical protein
MRQVVAGLFISALVATTAMAEESGTMAVAAPAAVTMPSAATGVAADQTPAPAAPAAPAEPGFIGFFKKTELSGMADFYYAYSANRPPAGSAIPFRVFDGAQNQMTLSMLEFGLTKPVDKDDPIGFKFVAAYGPAADTVNFAEPKGAAALQNVEQAYLSYYAPVGTGLTIDFGKFVTPLGNEVIEAKDNWNYSRGILFGYAIPFYHVGVRLGYSPNDKVSLGAQVTNGWNDLAENNDGKTVEGSIAVKPNAKTSISENYIVGQEEPVVGGPYRWVSDTILSYTLNDKVGLAANYDYGKEASASWQGIALYVRDQLNKVWAIAPRYEYYDDGDGFTTLVGQKAQEFTLTLEAKHSAGLITRFEYRHDMSNQNYFVGHDGAGKKNQDTFDIGIVLGFSSK